MSLMEEIGSYIEKRFGAPGRDKYDLTASKARFADGTHYRIELLPTTVEEYGGVFSLCDKHGLICNKITDTRGSMFDTDDEILRKCEMARERGVELVMSPGSGEHYADISHQMAARAIVEGKSRGMDMLVRTVADMMRDIELGCRGFLVYDEGVMLLVTQMRRDGIIPPETNFKISACISVANPLAVKFWIDKLGLGPYDSINPVRDLPLPQLAAIRAVTDQPLDIHAYWSTSISRTLDTPEIARVASPVYFKISRSGPGVSIGEKVLQGLRVVETVQRYYPEARQSQYRAKGSAVPARAGAWKFKFKE